MHLTDERVGSPRNFRASHVLDATVAKLKTQGLFDDPRIRERANHANAACRAAQLLNYQARQTRAAGALAAADAYLARVAIIKAERAVADFTAYACADDGVLSGTWEDGEFRTTFVAGMGGGSYEIQLNLVARLWLNMPKHEQIEGLARGA